MTTILIDWADTIPEEVKKNLPVISQEIEDCRLEIGDCFSLNMEGSEVYEYEGSHVFVVTQSIFILSPEGIYQNVGISPMKLVLDKRGKTK